MRRRLDPEARGRRRRPGPPAGAAPSGAGLLLALVVAALGSWRRSPLLGRSGAWRLPALWGADLRKAAAVLVFLGTYVVVAVGKLPGFRLDRAGAALLGASLMVAAARSRLRRPTAPSTSTRSRSCSA